MLFFLKKIDTSTIIYYVFISHNIFLRYEFQSIGFKENVFLRIHLTYTRFRTRIMYLMWEIHSRWQTKTEIISVSKWVPDITSLEAHSLLSCPDFHANKPSWTCQGWRFVCRFKCWHESANHEKVKQLYLEWIRINMWAGRLLYKATNLFHDLQHLFVSWKWFFEP